MIVCTLEKQRTQLLHDTQRQSCGTRNPGRSTHPGRWESRELSVVLLVQVCTGKSKALETWWAVSIDNGGKAIRAYRDRSSSKWAHFLLYLFIPLRLQAYWLMLPPTESFLLSICWPAWKSLTLNSPRTLHSWSARYSLIHPSWHVINVPMHPCQLDNQNHLLKPYLF